MPLENLDNLDAYDHGTNYNVKGLRIQPIAFKSNNNKDEHCGNSSCGVFKGGYKTI